jgi:hypothetical protein
MSIYETYPNIACDISNDIDEPILNPALDGSDCFVQSERLSYGYPNVAGNISVTYFFSQSDMLEEIKTNVTVARYYDTTHLSACERERRPIFKTQKERLQFVKYKLARSQSLPPRGSDSGGYGYVEGTS